MDEWLRQFVEDGIGGKVTSLMVSHGQGASIGDRQGALVGEEFAPRLTKVRGNDDDDDDDDDDDNDDNDDNDDENDAENDDKKVGNEEHKIVNPERKVWEDDEVPND